ncbi:MAG: DUF4340 domain-containing protein [Proteobacteria bacterium]|nr:DUF4340 domain-containing protein [Pseudomonadota bacterium]
MKPRQLVVYLLVFIVLGLFYYVYEVRLQEKEQELEEVRTRIFDLDPGQVTAVRFRNGRTEFHLIKAGPDSWRMLEPMDTPADRFAAEDLVRQVLDAKKDRVFKEPSTRLEAFGLDRPGISLTLMAGDRILAPALHLGHKNPLGQLIYARLGDSSEVFTVASPLGQALDKSLFDLRDKSLVLFPGEKIDELRIEDPGTMVLKKAGLRRWRLVEPTPGPADNDEVQKLVYRTLKGHVLRFADPEPSTDYGFDPPRVRLRVMSEGRIEAEIVVGRAEEKSESDEKEVLRPPRVEGYWVRNSERGQLALISPETAAGLELDPQTLKDRRLLPDLDRSALTGLEITRGAARFKAHAEAGRWEIEIPAGNETESWQVDSLLAGLEELKYKEILDALPETVERHGLAKPDLVIRLTAPGVEPIVIEAALKPEDGDRAAVRVRDGPVALVASADLTARLPRPVRPPEPAGHGEKKLEQ